MTIDILKEFGADTDEGLARCLNKEDFYLKMINMGLNDERFDNLEKDIASGDLEKAFETAHALKGVVGNLALTPIFEPVSTLTDLLRDKKEGDYAALCSEIKKQRQRLLSMDA